MPAALLAVELLVCEFRVRFVMKGGQVVRRNAPDVRMREVAVMSLSADSGPSTGNTSPIWIVEELRLSTRTRRVAKLCLRPTLPIKIERTCVLNRTGQQGNVYQAHHQAKWNPQSSAYGRFWIDVPSGERKRRTVSLGLCATQWIARLRLREYIERAGVCSKHRFHQIPVPGTTFRQQAEWWMESLFTRRRRPLKPATIYGWQHCLDRWILPNLGNKLVVCPIYNVTEYPSSFSPRAGWIRV